MHSAHVCVNVLTMCVQWNVSVGVSVCMHIVSMRKTWYWCYSMIILGLKRLRIVSCLAQLLLDEWWRRRAEKTCALKNTEYWFAHSFSSFMCMCIYLHSCIHTHAYILTHSLCVSLPLLPFVRRVLYSAHTFARGNVSS